MFIQQLRETYLNPYGDEKKYGITTHKWLEKVIRKNFPVTEMEKKILDLDIMSAITTLAEEIHTKFPVRKDVKMALPDLLSQLQQTQKQESNCRVSAAILGSLLQHLAITDRVGVVNLPEYKDQHAACVVEKDGLLYLIRFGYIGRGFAVNTLGSSSERDVNFFPITPDGLVNFEKQAGNMRY